MEWLRKLIGQVVSMIFMMVGITPPEQRRRNEKERDDA
jgi:hypothetical protein